MMWYNTQEFMKMFFGTDTIEDFKRDKRDLKERVDIIYKHVLLITETLGPLGTYNIGTFQASQRLERRVDTIESCVKIHYDCLKAIDKKLDHLIEEVEEIKRHLP